MSTEIRVIDLGFVNAFLIKTGDGYILIDTGIGQQWSKLETELLQAGCLPDKLKLVIITHGDGDHTGNGAQLQRKYQAKIAIHAADRAMIETGLEQKRTASSFLGKSFLMLGKLANRGSHFDTFHPDVLLEEGESLAVYGWDARVLHTPGHTSGSISILTEAGELFVGDTFSNRRHPAVAPFIENFEELRASVIRLKGLDAKIVYPGHGKPFAFESILAVPESRK
jgi:glyoxylase-like metal-dependent hydrolase (beta-lactamase superfamily II)